MTTRPATNAVPVPVPGPMADNADEPAAIVSEESARKFEQFRWHLGSTLFPLFAASFFDQVAHPAVAAAVDHTGRFAQSFTNRGLRSAAAEQVLLWGDETARAQFAEELKRKHRDVRGHGHNEYEHIRYSALDPQLWNWIALSGIFAYVNSFTPCTGIELTNEERSEIYQMTLELLGVLQLPGKSSALPATLADAEAHYEWVVHHQLEANRFLDDVVAGLTRLPLPTLGLPRFLRLALLPLWVLVRPVAGHVLTICSFGIMHPGVRALTKVSWGKRQQLEFRAITGVLPEPSWVWWRP